MNDDLLTYLDILTNSADVQELWAMHSARMASYGFDRIIYGFTRYRTSSSLGDPQDFVLLTNQSQDYIRPFIDDGLYFHAPMLKWALENNGACSWQWMEEMARKDAFTPAERKVVEFNLQHGVTAGYTISFRSVSARSKGAIALTARKGMSQREVEEIWSRHGDEIVVLNNVAHLKLITLPYTGSRTLTKRQREVLEYVGDGKTTQDTAFLLGLTPATVEKHLRLAREALDVDTTAQAILKAAFYNQMFVVDL
ncbi:helix-turn-helix transcriptional regulator [Flavimaricola marinus]|uniref:Autoinducer binding domain protein n=1 Tax=Flavimaricola marinus TaxID=1819565 RepID=A0A238LDD6_9RHOB|nr:LuxR family transcriptional regulator [Flavimaricola marinus]SMY07434.1 Autoinducer binding domain protein [Flavimaricola marinus]